uniref:Uncharacterized protein LOC117357171 n=1 Tax=Geotrypetes seraphini TaxID=260995 RepID=A0A6P8R0E7_GEOSA|nr:uncharacterized protein LOC117357171 [Geotrypetes seraphini]
MYPVASLARRGPWEEEVAGQGGLGGDELRGLGLPISAEGGKVTPRRGESESCRAVKAEGKLGRGGGGGGGGGESHTDTRRIWRGRRTRFAAARLLWHCWLSSGQQFPKGSPCACPSQLNKCNLCGFSASSPRNEIIAIRNPFVPVVLHLSFALKCHVPSSRHLGVCFDGQKKRLDSYIGAQSFTMGFLGICHKSWQSIDRSEPCVLKAQYVLSFDRLLKNAL